MKVRTIFEVKRSKGSSGKSLWTRKKMVLAYENFKLPFKQINFLPTRISFLRRASAVHKNFNYHFPLSNPRLNHSVPRVNNFSTFPISHKKETFTSFVFLGPNKQKFVNVKVDEIHFKFN